MTTGDLAARLRAACPAFAVVTHAGTSAAELDLPAAIVGRVAVQATPPDMLGHHLQMIRTTWGVWIMVRRRQDGAADDLAALDAAVIAALAAWEAVPGGAFTPLAYAGGQYVPWRDQVAEWRSDFWTETQLRVPA